MLGRNASAGAVRDSGEPASGAGEPPVSDELAAEAAVGRADDGRGEDQRRHNEAAWRVGRWVGDGFGFVNDSPDRP